MPSKGGKHPLKPTAKRGPEATGQQATPPAPQWPSYTGTSQFVGTSQNGRVTVYVDPSLGQKGLQNARDLVNDADRIVADSLPQCARLGEIHHALAAGVIAEQDVTELGQITSGAAPGRRTPTETIVCDLTGVGVQDVAAATVVMERALATRDLYERRI